MSNVTIEEINESINEYNKIIKGHKDYSSLQLNPIKGNSEIDSDTINRIAGLICYFGLANKKAYEKLNYIYSNCAKFNKSLNDSQQVSYTSSQVVVNDSDDGEIGNKDSTASGALPRSKKSKDTSKPALLNGFFFGGVMALLASLFVSPASMISAVATTASMAHFGFVATVAGALLSSAFPPLAIFVVGTAITAAVVFKTTQLMAPYVKKTIDSMVSKFFMSKESNEQINCHDGHKNSSYLGPMERLSQGGNPALRSTPNDEHTDEKHEDNADANSMDKGAETSGVLYDPHYDSSPVDGKNSLYDTETCNSRIVANNR